MNVKHTFLKSLLAFLVMSLFISSIHAASQVLNVEFNEYVEEDVLYNPLNSPSGEYFDTTEQQRKYNLSGQIFVENTHATQAIQNVLLNVTGISDIYNISQIAGSQGYISEFNITQDYMLIYIPDLGAGSNVTFSYKINTSNITPPLNYTSSYSESRIFSGLPITITDVLENTLNSTAFSDTCIYDINVSQLALGLNSSGTILNSTFVPSSLAGSDAGNVVFSANNRTLNWSVLSSGCLTSGNTTDISYDLRTPTGVNSADDYKIVNSTTNYKFNSTFSGVSLSNSYALLDLDLEFEKYLNNTLTGDNATWRITSQAFNPTDINVNLTQVTLWVSQRNGTGTGFTNPALRDSDTITGADLIRSYSPNMLLNSTTGAWNNTGSEWFFNYTFSSSPIVWMDAQNEIIDDGLQMVNRSISYGQNQVYVKEIYIATGYWLQVSKNITRLSDEYFNVKIDVVNLGTSPTPSGQVVQIYNFVPNTFSLNGSIVFSSSPWYTTVSTNETLTDPTYNGTMFQFGLLPSSNPANSSLASYGGSITQNNSWSATYNVTGSGEFAYDDLFLTGADPLNVQEYGSTQSISVEGVYSTIVAKTEYVLAGVAAVVAMLVVFM